MSVSPLHLIRRGPDGSEERIPLRNTVLIGREVDDVVLRDDRYLSGRHATVQRTDDGAILIDHNWTNGTFLRVTGDIELRSGDVFAVGRQLYRFVG